MATRDESIFYDIIYPHFEKICTLRHPSYEETELVNYLIDFAKENNLRYETDKHGNIAIYRDASPGCENFDPVMFQGHTDMVCVPDKDIFPIKPVITDGWVHTEEKSTLGADNGIALAMMLELLIMDFDENPPIECLFTTAEEVGLIGASNIELDKFSVKATKLINIDSEDIKFITVGCAGAKNLEIVLPVKTETCSEGIAFDVEVTAPGGHSGLVIHENIPNAIIIAAEIADELLKNYSGRLVGFTGGFARNAIPAIAEVTVCADGLSETVINGIFEDLKKKHSDLQEFVMSLKKSEARTEAMTAETAKMLLDLVLSIPHGVVKMNPDTGGVLSSNNLAMIEKDGSNLKVIMSSRSCDLAEVDEILDGITEKAHEYAGVEANKDEGYPGWRPDMDSELLKTTTSVFEEVLGTKPDYLDIHAGLECGILMNKFPVIKEAVSIGPNLHQVHSIKERLEIATTIDIWNIVQELIKKFSR